MIRLLLHVFLVYALLTALDVFNAAYYVSFIVGVVYAAVMAFWLILREDSNDSRPTHFGE